MAENVTTASERAAFGMLGGVVAISAPPFIPPFYVAYRTGRFFYGTLHWHPLFAIIVGVLALAVMAFLLLFMLIRLSRKITTAAATLYFTACYGLTAHFGLHLDYVWSGAIACVAAAVGAAAGWYGTPALKEALEGTSDPIQAPTAQSTAPR